MNGAHRGKLTDVGEHTRRHMPGLDGLRGLLVPIVLLYHLGVVGFGGFLALEGFFVLSGFLITSLLLDDPPADLSELARWWLRRCRRLVPAVVVVVAVTLAAFPTTDGVVVDALSTLTWWRNWEMAYGSTTYWSTVTSPLKHMWSLSVEEQFYLLFPLLVVGVLWVARRSRWPRAMAVAAACSVITMTGYAWQAFLATEVSLNRVYLGSDTRAASILLGCTAGALMQRSKCRWEPAPPWLTASAIVGLAAIVGLGFALEIEGIRTYQGGFIATALSWLAITVAASRPGPIATSMSFAPLRWMGVRSYGIYLWSWPVQVFVQSRWPTLGLPALASITVVVSFALGALSLYIVERPLREGSGWASSVGLRRTAWAGGLAVTVVAMLIVDTSARGYDPVGAMTERSTARDAMSSVEELLEASEAPASDAVTTSVGSTAAPTVPSESPVVQAPSGEPPALTAAPPTAVPPPAAPLTVLVGGDSQAATIAHGVRRSELPGYIGVVANAGVLGCGVLVRTVGWMVDNPARGGLVDGSYCRGERSAEAAEILGLSARPDWLVITSGGYEQSHAYLAPDGSILPANGPEIRQAVKDALGDRIARANASGTRVALLEFVCPGRRPGEPNAEEFTRESIEWHNSNLREVAAEHPGTITIPATDRVCVDADPGGAPTAVKAKAWGTPDRVHVTDRGQAWVWNVQIGPALWAASVTG